MKKIIILFILLITLTGCSDSGAAANNGDKDTTNKKNEIYEEIEKQKEEQEVEYEYLPATLSLRKAIMNYNELKDNRKNIEDVLICEFDVSVFVYSDTDDVNIYSIENDKLYSEEEVKDFDFASWCKDQNRVSLEFHNKKEIEYLKK